MTQAELASLINKTPRMICHWERGTRRISFEDAKKIADALGIKIDELVKESEVVVDIEQTNAAHTIGRS